MTDKKVPHLHAALIKEWADGASIQYKDKGWDDDDEWRDTSSPTWSRFCFYRKKPEPKPDVVMYCCVDKKQYSNGLPFASVSWVTNANTELLKTDNVMFVFDGETGVLKDVQLLAHE